MSERTPLLNYRLSASVNESEWKSARGGHGSEQHPGNVRKRSGQQRQPKKLSTFFGVVIPTLLSMFSVVVFLRIGERTQEPKSEFQYFNGNVGPPII